jgi:pre-mRNA-splicing helicase BRR2
MLVWYIWKKALLNLANSNLVLQADRSLIGKRSSEPTGEAESLWGKINTKTFGDRARPDSNGLAERKRKGQSANESNKKKKGFDKGFWLDLLIVDRISSRYSSVLATAESMEVLNYQPKTKLTQETYELILAFLSRFEYLDFSN